MPVNPAAAGQSPITTGQAEVPLVVRFMMILTERHDALQQLVSDQINAIQAGTAELNELREALQVVRANRPDGDSDDKATINDDATCKQLKDTCTKYGIEVTGFDDWTNTKIKGTQSKYDSLASNIETAIDSRSGSSQIQTIQLQSLIQKDDAGLTMLNSIVSADGQAMKEKSRWS